MIYPAASSPFAAAAARPFVVVHGGRDPLFPDQFGVSPR